MELVLFVDLIMGSYLWAGVLADVFVTLRTILQVQEGIRLKHVNIAIGLRWSD